MNFILKNAYKKFSTSATNYTIKREGKILRKLINGREKGNKNWYTNNGIGIGSASDKTASVSSAKELSRISNRGKEAIRRVAVLNKLFMTHITDRMATGEASEFILGHCIEVSRVKITNDFQKVNVYWISKGNENDKEIERILNASAGSIRHELSQLRLMGEVPKIYFLKDLRFARIAEVDALLERAEFGDDYVPATNEDKIKIKLDVKSNNTNEIPKMNNNVFGLNQDEIMSRIKINLTKTKSAWERYERTKTENTLTQKTEDNNENIIILENRDKEFAKFLRDRQIYNKNKNKSVSTQNDVFKNE